MEQGYLQKVFPSLFPRGEMRIDNTNRRNNIAPVAMLKHIARLADPRFQKNKQFQKVALDLKNKFQALKFTRYLLSTNPSNYKI